MLIGTVLIIAILLFMIGIMAISLCVQAKRADILQDKLYLEHELRMNRQVQSIDKIEPMEGIE